MGDGGRGLMQVVWSGIVNLSRELLALYFFAFGL